MPDIDSTELTSQLLGNHIEFADRFVYSSYFVPLPMQLGDGGPPALTVQQKKNLKTYYRINPDLVRSALEKLGFEEIVKDAGDYVPAPVVTPEQVPQVVARELELLANQMRTQLHDVEVLAAPETEEAAGVANRLVAGKLAELGSAAQQITAQAQRLESAQYAMSSAAAPTRGPTRGPAGEPELTEAEKLDLILNLIKSEVGWLFLDRTRIRPNGYAVGEHVHTMSLAPGEELVMEQKAFTKRQATYEEQNEQERQFDIELSSTFSTELQEGLDQQTNQNSTGAQGLAGMTGIDAKVNLFDIASFEKFKVTDASNETKRRSVKDSQTTTAKLSSKYRGLHKITFKVTTETGFESSAKRTIRNPNKYTPLQLHYFKMLPQKLKLSQALWRAPVLDAVPAGPGARGVETPAGRSRCHSRGRRGRPGTARISRDTERRRQTANLRRRHACRRQVESRWRYGHHCHHPDPDPTRVSVGRRAVQRSSHCGHAHQAGAHRHAARGVRRSFMRTAVASHGADHRDTAQGLAGRERMVIGVHRGERRASQPIRAPAMPSTSAPCRNGRD